MKICLACEVRFSASGWDCPSCGHQPQLLSGITSFAPELSEARSGFDPAYFERLFRLEDGNFWFQSRNALLLWAIRRFFPTTRNFLEIGCGTGFVLAGIGSAHPEISLTGSEIHAEGLVWTSQRLRSAAFLQMDARRIPFESEFDLIGAFDVIEHITEDEHVLSEAHRAIRPGGGLLLTVPQHRFLWSAADDYAYHKRRYSRGELVSKVRNAGFTVECCMSFVSILMPALIFSRLFNRSAANYDPEAEFRIGPSLDKVMRAIMTAERGMLNAGVRFPFGGSLLLAARRASS